MNQMTPVAPGWYPDDASGGTRYWDGSRWTGDTRPKRRPFAPSFSFGPLGWIVILLGLLWMGISVGAYGETGESGYVIGGIVVPVVATFLGIFLLRGQGPSTTEVEERLAEERKQVRAKRRSANIASFGAMLFRSRAHSGDSSAPAGEATTVAQIEAITNPESARALQNLQNLLYTRAISDAEFQAAKDKLLGVAIVNDAIEQIRQLNELHEAGILGDVEFAAAKAKALGI